MREWMYLGYYTDCADSVDDNMYLNVGWIRLAVA